MIIEHTSAKISSGSNPLRCLCC